MILNFSARNAFADGYPPGDVSCSFSDNGVNYGVSISFTGTTVLTSLSYEWEYALLVKGKSPELVSSYGDRKAFKRTGGNGLSLTYNELLSLANNDPNAYILMFANTIYDVGNSSVKNINGKGCYLDLPAVLAHKNSVSNQPSPTPLPSNNAPIGDTVDNANEATDAANAATDAANAAAEAADAATAATQDMQAAIAAMSTQLNALIAGFKAQLSVLANLVLKIQKKIKS